MRSILAVMHLATPQKFSFAQGQTNWPLPREEGCTMEMLWLISTQKRKKKVCMISWVSLVLRSSIG